MKPSDGSFDGITFMDSYPSKVYFLLRTVTKEPLISLQQGNQADPTAGIWEEWVEKYDRESQALPFISKLFDGNDL